MECLLTVWAVKVAPSRCQFDESCFDAAVIANYNRRNKRKRGEADAAVAAAIPWIDTLLSEGKVCACCEHDGGGGPTATSCVHCV